MSASVLSALPYATAVIATVGAWAAGLAYMDVFTPDDVKAWRRLAGLRGYATPRGPLEKLVIRTRFVRRLQDELDINRLLGIANRPDTPVGFVGQTFAKGGIVALVVLAGDSFYRVTQGDWILGVGPWVALAFWLVICLLALLQLKREATRRQEAAGRALGDMMMLVAIMTDGRGLQLEDAVRILARCVTDASLEGIVDRRGWQRLVRQPYRSTIELYQMIGDEYRIPAFNRLADAAANSNVGFAERDTYTRMAKGVYQQRLAEARVKAARAKILVTLPVAGMLIPLLILLGAPTLHSITVGLSGQ